MMGQKKIPEISSAVRNYLELNFPLPADRTTDCCLNGHVILLYTNTGQSQTRTIEHVNKLFEVQATYGHVRNFLRKYKKWAKPDDQQLFEDFCKKSFMASNSNNLTVQRLSGYREFLARNFSLPPAEEITTSAISCKNGHAVHLYYNENRSAIETSKEINKLFGLSSNQNDIKRLVNKTKNWLRSYREPGRQNFEALCNEPFVWTVSTKPSISSVTNHSTDPTHLLGSAQCNDLPQPSSNPTFATVGTNTGEDLPRLSRENLTSKEIQLKNRLSHLSQQIAIATKKHRSKVAVLKSKLKDMPLKLKVLNQKVKRKSVTIKALREKIHELKKNTNRKKIQSLKVKKCAWKIKHSDQTNGNVLVITNTEKTNNLEIIEQPPEIGQPPEVGEEIVLPASLE